MLLVFIDETSDSKFQDYLGFSIATINHVFYQALKLRAQKILEVAAWNPSIEFKGSYLFSATKGDPAVDVAARVRTAQALLALNKATSNSRMRFHYGKMRSTDHNYAYLTYLPSLLEKCLPKPQKGQGKALIAVHCDERSGIAPDDLQRAFLPPISKRGYVLLERVAICRSSHDTVGVMFADLVGYLASRVDTIANDAEFIEGITADQFEKNGKLRKLRTSTALISKIKRLTVYAAN